MSNKNDLQALYESLGLSPEGVAIVEAIRDGNPVRRQATGQQSSAGGFSSSKTGLVIGVESRTLEMAYVRTQEASSDVLEFYDQPYKLRLRTTRADGRSAIYTHTPDFLVIAKGSIAFVELKPEARLAEKASKDPRRFFKKKDQSWTSPAAEEALAGSGIAYRVVSDRDLNPFLIRNITFLSDFRRAA